MSRRTAIILISAVAAVLLGTTALAVAQIVWGDDDRPPASPPTTLPAPREPASPSQQPDEPWAESEVDGVPVRIQTAAVSPDLVAHARTAITWTQLYNTRDCRTADYPGFDVAAVTAMTTGPLAEDLAYQRYDWDHPRSSDVEACKSGPPVFATVTGATIPSPVDGTQQVIVTYLTDTGGQLDSTSVGYTITGSPGQWKLGALDENPPLHS